MQQDRPELNSTQHEHLTMVSLYCLFFLNDLVKLILVCCAITFSLEMFVLTQDKVQLHSSKDDGKEDGQERGGEF